MSESERNKQDTAVYGDVVGGDKITIGDIGKAKGVAVGSGSRVIINEVLSKPLLILMGGLVVMVILIMTILILQSPNDEKKPLKLVNISELFGVFSDGDLLNDVVVQGNFVWFATNHGLLAYDEEERRSEWLLEGEKITAVAEGSDEIWIGTNSGYLGRVVSFDAIEVNTSPQSEIRAIFVDEEGQAWVADSDRGIWLYAANGSFINQTISLPDDEDIFDLAVLKTSESMIVWALTFPGIYRWKDGQWAILDSGDSIPSEAEFYRVSVDSIGNSWFAHSGGITHIKFRNESLSRSDFVATTCTAAETNLPSGPINDMVIDEDWLWLVTPYGIARKNLVDDDPDICANWQAYPTEIDNKWMLEGRWRLDFRSNSCNGWVAASSEARAYRINFEC